jgi:hypothetical protein
MQSARAHARSDPRFVPALRDPNEDGRVSQQADPATVPAAVRKVGRN